MIFQQRQALNDNDLHTLLYKGENGINHLLISRFSGMHILDALSVANHYSPDPQIKEYLIKTTKDLFRTDSELPRLLQRYDLTLQILEDDTLNAKQFISLYSLIMKAKIKEFYTNQKYQLFCNVYVPPKYTRTLNIYCYSPTLTGYISLIKTDAMTTLLAMEEMMDQIDNKEQQKYYTFDQLFVDDQPQLLNVTPEKEQKFVRRHKKSLSEHQIFDFQREQKLIKQEPALPQDKALFFSQAKQQFVQDEYQFPSLDQISNPNPIKQFFVDEESTKQFQQPQIQQKIQQQLSQKFEEGANIDDLDFFPPLEMSSLTLSKQSSEKKQPTNQLYTGRLKFFDEQKNYGFIVMDDDKSDIFVHLDDLQKAGVTKEMLKTAKQGFLIRFQFNCMVYVGKYKKSRKAVELKLLSNQSANNLKGYP